MSRPDWRDMTRGDFTTDDAPATLFELEPGNVPPPDDGCGTGDLFAMLDDAEGTGDA